MEAEQSASLMATLERMAAYLERIALAAEQISLEQPGLPALPASQESSPPAPTLPLKTFAEDVSNWLCPIHHDFKVVPAGISRKTGLPYTAFIACSSPGCNEKPSRFSPAQQQLQKLP